MFDPIQSAGSEKLRKLEKHYKRVSMLLLGFALTWLIIDIFTEINPLVRKIESGGFILFSLYVLSIFFRIQKIEKDIKTIKEVLDI
jgi:hypothetical protein